MIRSGLLISFWIGLLIFTACDNPLNPKTETLRVTAKEEDFFAGGDKANLTWDPTGESLLYTVPVRIHQFFQYDFEHNLVSEVGTFLNELSADNYDLYNPVFSNDFEYAIFVGCSKKNYQPDRYDLWLYQFSNQSLTEMGEFDNAQLSAKIAWSHKNEQFAIPVIYYENYRYRTEIHVYSIDGNYRVYPVDDLETVWSLVWSGDDHTIGFYGRISRVNCISILDLESGNCERVLDETYNRDIDSSIQWLADHRTIVYCEDVQNNEQIHLYNLETQQNTVLVDSVSSFYFFIPPENSNEIQFVAYPGSNLQLFTYRIQENELSQATVYRDYDSPTIFSNKYIVENQIESVEYLMSYSIENGYKDILMAGPFTNFSLTWGMDGSYFLFTRENHIYKYSLRDKKESLVYTGMDAYRIESSPDGRSVAFDEGNGNIQILDLETNATVHMNPDLYPHLKDPTWSPSGNKVASLDRNGNIVIFKKIDKTVFQYDRTIGGAHMDIQWSKMKGNDNAPILYIHGVETESYPRTYDIRAIEPEKQREYILSSILNEHFACWSADGTCLAYVEGNKIRIEPLFAQLDSLN